MREKISSDIWDNYWQAGEESSALADLGSKQEALDDFWQHFFSKKFENSNNASLLDIACGNGAVIRCAQASASHENGLTLNLSALDYSMPAISDLKKRYHNVEGILANAVAAPFESGSFNIVCSQFGVEYAGAAAIEEAARLVAPSGTLATVLHYKHGAIYEECRQNKNAVSLVLKSRALPLFQNLFETAVDVSKGKKSANKFKLADKKLAPAIEEVKRVLNKYGADVANGGVLRLMSDLGQMYKNIEAYDPTEVYRWIRGMDRELKLYHGRMSAMLLAALDEATISNVKQSLLSQNFIVKQLEPYHIESSADPVAWTLIAGKT